MLETRGAMTAEEYLIHPSHRYGELVSGTMRVAEPPGGIHGVIAAQIARLLGDYVRRESLGTVLVEAGYLLARNPDTVRGPDVSFVTTDRLSRGNIPGAFIPGAPDLAIEVFSPGDTLPEMLRKVADYLEAGARLVWVVAPVTGTVAVYHPSRPSRTLSGGDLLDGEDVVPGFSLAVSELLL